MAAVKFEIQAVATGTDQIEKIKAKLLETEKAQEAVQAAFKKAGLSDKQAAKAAGMHAAQEASAKADAAKKTDAATAQTEARKKYWTEANKTASAEAFGAMASGAAIASAGALALVASFGALFVKIGNVAFEAAKFKQDTIRALTYVEGSAKAANDTYKTIGSYSKLAGVQKSVIADAMIAVKQAGFDKTSAENIVAAASDVDARGGQGGSFAKALQQLKVKERLDSATLSQVASAINDPLFEKEFLKQIGASRGLNVSNAMAIENVKGLLDSGQIKEKEGLDAILGLVERRVTKIGKLGSAAIDKADNTWDGQLARLKGSFNDLLENVNIKPIIGALERVAQAFNPATESGAKFAKIFEDLFSKGGSLLDEYLTPENITKVFRTITDVLSGVKSGFMSFIDAAKPGLEAFAKAMGGGENKAVSFESTMRAIGETAGAVVSIMARVAAGFVWFQEKVGFASVALLAFAPPLGLMVLTFKALAAIVSKVGDVAKTVFEWIGDKVTAVIDGISKATSKLTGLLSGTGGEAVEGLKVGWGAKAQEAVEMARKTARDMADASRDELKIKSPSKVFEEIGGYAAEGFAGGFSDTAEGPDVSKLTDVRGQGKGAVGARTNTFNIAINMGNGNGNTADLETAVRRIFERVAEEMA